MVVKEGISDIVFERFKVEGLIKKQTGFINLNVLFKKVCRGDKEVLIMTHWESETDWKYWEKSPEHIADHRARLGKPKPNPVIEKSQDVYEVKAQK